MKILLLGTAAGGGFPQWNCACQLCKSGLPSRTQDCVAISANGLDWYLLNASPDIRAQILGSRELAAGPGVREIPLRGVFLTDAELDHTLGLTMLREGAGLRVWAPSAVLGALQADFPLREIVARYGNWAWDNVGTGLEVDGLRFTVFPVGDKRPKYVRSEGGGPWVVAYRVEDMSGGGVLVYAPCLATWPDGFDELVSDAACVILDGTFYSANEMAGSAGVGGGAQRAMGHIPMSGPDGSLARIGKHAGKRWIYTHLNNTNPVLDPGSSEYGEIVAGGGAVVDDGTLVEI